MGRLFFLCVLLNSWLFVQAQKETRWLHAEEVSKKGFFYNHGMTKGPQKLGLVFSNNSDGEITKMIRLNNAHINKIFLYKKDGDTLYKTGDHFYFENRPVQFPDFIFPVSIKPHTNDSLVLSLDKSGENLRYFIEVKDPADIQSAMNRELIIFGILICFCLISSAMFIIWGFLRKNFQHVLFALLIIATSAWSLNNMGVLFEFIWPRNPLMQHSVRTILSGLSLGLMLLQIYFHYRIKMNRWVKYFLFFFISFFMLRMMVSVMLPRLYNDAVLKYTILLSGTSITLASLLLVLLTIVFNMRYKEMILHNIGYLIYFIYPIREALLQFGMPFDPVPEHNEFVSGVFYFGPLGFIAWGNLQQYRSNRKKKTANDIEEARLKEMELGEKIVDAQEYERSSIGKNLHDQVGGLLSVMKIKMQMLKKKQAAMSKELDELISIVDAGSNEILNIVDDLIPPEFDRLRLNEILQNRIRIFETGTGISFHFSSTIHEMDRSLSLRIYRIICELITNSVKHANCSEISIRLFERDETILLHYRDNGKGMDLSKIKMNHGIRNIQSRIQHLGGKLEFSSRPGNTEFDIGIPLTFGL